MFYKEKKQLVAHCLLFSLQKECRIYTKIAGQPMYQPSYLWINLKKLHQRIKWYNIETLRDAAWELKNSGEIDILDNLYHIYDIQLGILPKGLTAYKEKTHIWNFLKSWKIIIVSVSSVLIALLVITEFLQKLFSLSIPLH